MANNLAYFYVELNADVESIIVTASNGIFKNLFKSSLMRIDVIA